MTIQEAIKSGRPFRRLSVREYERFKKWNIWYMVRDGGGRTFFDECELTNEKPYEFGNYINFGIDDILAEDWEVKEQ